jgi:hypothetical protein
MKTGFVKGEDILIKNHLDQSFHTSNQEKWLNYGYHVLKLLAQSHFITPNQHQLYIILHPKHIVPCAKGNALPTTQGCDLKAWVFGQDSVKWKFCNFPPNFSWGISLMSKCTDHMVYFV